MADGSIVLNANQILTDFDIGTKSEGHGQGELTVNSGSSVFESDDIIVINMQGLDGDGQITPDSRTYSVVVYDNVADYHTETPKYSYISQNAVGQNIQSGVSGLGDSYARLHVNAFNAFPPDAPDLNQMFIFAIDIHSALASGPVRFKTIEPGGDGNFNGDSTPICFCAGTPILTETGSQLVEELRIGDKVLTRDHGYQSIRWIGHTTRPAFGKMAPVEFAVGTISNDAPLRVSQQHRILLTDWRAELMFGADAVLVPAKALINDQSVRLREGGHVDYFHIMFDRHTLVMAAGCWSESFYPGDTGITSLDHDTRQELLTLFPTLPNARKPTSTILPVLKPYELSAIYTH